MKTVYIYLGFKDSFWGGWIFQKFSQDSQKPIFPSQNSVFKKAFNTARISVGREK